MDNLTHTLAGAALAKTRLGRMSRLAPVALVVGANLPDADSVTLLVADKAAYLVHHRGLTHSLLGVVIEAFLLASVLFVIERRQSPRDSRTSFTNSLVPALVGLASHPLLDLLNNYGLRPFLPFSDRRFFGDLVFIVDPILWLLFGAMAGLAGVRSKIGSWTWGVLAAGATLVLLASQRTPEHLKWYWPFAVGALALMRVIGVGRELPRRVLAVGSLLVVLYLGGLELSARLAWRNVLAVQDPSAGIAAGIQEPWRIAMRSPVIANPLHWTFILETPDTYYMREVDVAGRMRATGQVGPRLLADARVLAAAATQKGAAWRYFARLPWAWIEPHPDGSARVGLSDARYHFAQGPTWCSVEVDLPRPAGTPPLPR